MAARDVTLITSSSKQFTLSSRQKLNRVWRWNKSSCDIRLRNSSWDDLIDIELTAEALKPFTIGALTAVTCYRFKILWSQYPDWWRPAEAAACGGPKAGPRPLLQRNRGGPNKNDPVREGFVENCTKKSLLSKFHTGPSCCCYATVAGATKPIL